MSSLTEAAGVPPVGAPAPDFNLPDATGTEHRLSDLRGRWVVLYFYPADDTPGCTTEACQFRDLHAEIEATGAVVLGVSPDDRASHARFRDKYGLPFALLADVDHRVAEAYGVWQLKTSYGRSQMGIVRSTFLIDPEGRIARVWPKVKADGHAAEVLAALTAEQARRRS
ncbi:MAG TPA: thioredoxin-dependent thiol peroxidase [Candidatus Binatia bacterium]|nr:thioredoxin-dependent thiol peroxidase [Candidatus Binatia bacterium]